MFKIADKHQVDENISFLVLTSFTFPGLRSEAKKSNTVKLIPDKTLSCVCLAWPLVHLESNNCPILSGLESSGGKWNYLFSCSNKHALSLFSVLISLVCIDIMVLSVLSSHLGAQTQHLISNFLTFHIAHFVVQPLSLTWGYLEFTDLGQCLGLHSRQQEREHGQQEFWGLSGTGRAAKQGETGRDIGTGLRVGIVHKSDKKCSFSIAVGEQGIQYIPKREILKTGSFYYLISFSRICIPCLLIQFSSSRTVIWHQIEFTFWASTVKRTI